VSARPLRTVVAIVVAVAATWFVARPAPGASARGGVAWRAALEEGPSDLAADPDGVVVTTSAQSVYLLDARGKVRWRVPVTDQTFGQPALGTDVVVVGGTDAVSGLARTDGTLRWCLPRADAARSLAVSGDTVLVGDDSGTLAAVDATTGVPRWEVRYAGALWSGARVDVATGAVVATWHQSESPAVRVFDLATGVLRWEAPTDRFTGAPAVHGGRVVLAIGDGHRHARVEARDLATGDLRWQTVVPASFEEAIEPAVDDDAVAVVDHFGVASLLDPVTGKLRWQHDLADVLLAARVVLTGSRVAFTSYAGVLHVLDRRDGHELAALAPGRLGGLPVATTRSPWSSGGQGRGGGGDVLVAVRLREWGVQLRRLP
jgi:outer membrane protein assembly factor BamB